MKISDYIFKHTSIELYSSEWEQIDKLPLMVKPQLTDEEMEFIKSQNADIEELEKYSLDDMKQGLSQDLIDVIPDIKKLLSIINKLTKSKK